MAKVQPIDTVGPFKKGDKLTADQMNAILRNLKTTPDNGMVRDGGTVLESVVPKRGLDVLWGQCETQDIPPYSVFSCAYDTGNSMTNNPPTLKVISPDTSGGNRHYPSTLYTNGPHIMRQGHPGYIQPIGFEQQVQLRGTGTPGRFGKVGNFQMVMGYGPFFCIAFNASTDNYWWQRVVPPILFGECTADFPGNGIVQELEVSVVSGDDFTDHTEVAVVKNFLLTDPSQIIKSGDRVMCQWSDLNNCYVVTAAQCNVEETPV